MPLVVLLTLLPYYDQVRRNRQFCLPSEEDFNRPIVINDNYLHIRSREVKGLYFCICVIGFPTFVIVKGRERFYRVAIRSLGFTEKKVVHENVRKE